MVVQILLLDLLIFLAIEILHGIPKKNRPGAFWGVAQPQRWHGQDPPSPGAWSSSVGTDQKGSHPNRSVGLGRLIIFRWVRKI